MAKTLRATLKSIYRNYWHPFVRATATGVLRLCVCAATALKVIRPATPGGPECFLVVSLAGHLGDTVMLLPMLEALRQAHPHARIECAVESSSASLLRMVPGVDHVHEFPLGSAPPTTLRLALRRAVAVLGCFWRDRDDLRPSTCVLPRWGDDLFRSTLLAYLTQAPRRVGFASDDVSGQRTAPYRDALLTDRIRGAADMHDPARFVFLLQQAGLIPVTDIAAISTGVSTSLIVAAASVPWGPLARRIGLSEEERFAVIAPGASMPRRVWPVARWLPVMEHLAANGLKIVLVAGRSDAGIAGELFRLATQQGQFKDVMILLAGQTSIPESVALISHAEQFFGNDSGPGHVAGALGIPSTILFIADATVDPNDPAAPERVRPQGPRVFCVRPDSCVPPCRGSCTESAAHCICEITSATVLEASLAGRHRA